MRTSRLDWTAGWSGTGADFCAIPMLWQDTIRRGCSMGMQSNALLQKQVGA
jgi:hypothetical protein